MAVWTLVVSLLAVAATVVLGVAGWRLSARVTGIEQARRTEELEARKSASVSASIEKRPGGTGSWLILTNHGPAQARNVTFDPASVEDAIGTEKLPLSALAPRQEFPFVLALAHGSPDVVELSVRWEDDLGPHVESFILSTL
jgi:hypothetical protein